MISAELVKYSLEISQKSEKSLITQIINRLHGLQIPRKIGRNPFGIVLPTRCNQGVKCFLELL
jgi:hypothetical protein